MAQYRVPDDPDKILECPFDNTHMIRACRMPYHIIDCERNHRHLNFQRCPFNARHWKPKAEIEHHKRTCPDRNVISTFQRSTLKENLGTYFRGNCSNPEYRDDHIKEPSGEDWDAECDEERRIFTWGEDIADEYFSEAATNRIQLRDEPSGQMRLPHAAPQVLQQQLNNYDNGNRKSWSDNQPMTQRLPNTLPKAAMGLGGVGRGRGRGYGTLQQAAAPSVGGASSSSGGSTVNGTGRGFETSEIKSNPSRPPYSAGRGRGYGQPQTNGIANNTNRGLNGGLVGQNGSSTDDDARSTCSSTSTTSEMSCSSGRSGKPRKVNAPPLGASNQPHNVAFPAPPPQQPFNSVMPSGLKGMGRGGARPKMSNNRMGRRNDETPVENGYEENGGKMKQVRKVQKKLREIEALETKRNRGTALNEDEESKIMNKMEVLALLEDIRMQQD